MTMTREPLQLSAGWSERLSRDGTVELGVLSQAQLMAAGVDLGDSDASTRELRSSFERLDPAARQRAVQEAATTPVDPAVQRLLSSAMSNLLVHGTWHRTPPWFLPLDASLVSSLRGAALPDGSMACVEARTDYASSQVTVTVRTLADQARHLAADFFAPPPPLPAEAVAGSGWTSESGGDLVIMTLTWPHGRGTRSVSWRITRLTADMDTGFLQARRDWGLGRKSDDVTLAEPELARRLQEMFETAWSQAG